jgi:predicted RNA binding protein YcfA (HicA-like mRNA interferase family)
VTRQSGSHRRMTAPGRPPVTIAFHDRETVSSGAVKKILTKDIGLAEVEARQLL